MTICNRPVDLGNKATDLSRSAQATGFAPSAASDAGGAVTAVCAAGRAAHAVMIMSNSFAYRTFATVILLIERQSGTAATPHRDERRAIRCADREALSPVMLHGRSVPSAHRRMRP